MTLEVVREPYTGITSERALIEEQRRALVMEIDALDKLRHAKRMQVRTLEKMLTLDEPRRNG